MAKAKTKAAKPDIVADAPIVPALKLGKAVKEPRVILDHEHAEAYAMIAAMEKVLTDAKKTLLAQLTDASTNHIVSKGLEDKTRPPAFMFAGDHSQTTVVLAMRAVTKLFNGEELGKIKALNLPLGEQELVPQRYFINPEVVTRLLTDDDLRAKFSKAVQKLLGTKDDVILIQPAQTNKTVSDATIEALFKLEDGEVTLPAANEDDAPVVKHMTAAEQVRMVLDLLLDIKLTPTIVGDTPLSFGEAFRLLQDEGILPKDEPAKASTGVAADIQNTEPANAPAPAAPTVPAKRAKRSAA